jgi:hypothetical protein
LKIANKASSESDKKLNSNVIDPFSAVFDSLRQNISLTEWLEQEKARQIQKTLQNAVGEFHQSILGSVDGWENMKSGNVIDLVNESKKIIAEVKNKFNTTKGNHKISIYDDIYELINSKYLGYLGYYVEIIPKSKKPYNKEFTPSDNKSKSRRPQNQMIRIIDGKSFYELVTGKENSLEELYKAIPTIITELLKTDHTIVTNDSNFLEIYNKAYS